MASNTNIIKKAIIVLLTFVAMGCWLSTGPDQDGDDPITFDKADLTASWTAYNDCVNSASGNAANVTQINNTNTTGTLLKYSDGTPTSISVTMDSNNISPWNSSGTPDPGTDAHDTFTGIVNIDENASYDGNSDWHYQATFTGLDPAKRYAFIATANRNDVAYDGSGSSSRWTRFSISGADTYTNVSSDGVVEISDDVVRMNTGYNTTNGYVVAWTNISAADGSFTVRSENVGASGPGEPNKSYGFQGFVLKELQ